MAEHHQLSIRIDLGGMTARMQRLLRHAMNLVAIGLHARQDVTQEALSIPDVTMHHQYDASNRWTVEEAKTAWETWILRNGFRDTSEALAGILEEAQSVLSYWQVVLIQKERGLHGEDWNEVVDHRAQQFHRRTLPQKLKFLRDKYSFELEPALVRQALSINAARNCLTHRGGFVAEADTDQSGRLVVEWSAMVLLATVDGEEREITLPYRAEAGTVLGIATRSRSKNFEIGTLFHVSAEEFTQICWTLFLFTETCTKTLQEWAENRGFEFKGGVA
jgi:hypothetical protein